MSKYGCEKCGARFADNAHLVRHKARKTPCDPILNAAPLQDQKDRPACRYCGRSFSSKTAMHRHTRHSCKIANTEEGMERLMDHTIQRQLAEQSAQIAKLTALVERMAPAAPQTAQQIAQHVEGPAQLYNAPVTNNAMHVHIHPWDGDRRVGVDIAHVVAAFADNARLREYSRLGDHELADPEIAPPYVTELLMDLTKRAHADPASRNIYLNPKRADQVLVHKKTGAWEVLPFAEATRLIFDGVARTIHRLVMTHEERTQLPLEAQNALSMSGMLYDDEPDEYARRAKVPMSAHLANTAPAAAVAAVAHLATTAAAVVATHMA